MIYALTIAGWMQIALAVAHIPIARHLGWRNELQRNTLLTREVFWSHTWFVCLTLVIFGAIPAAALLTPSPLARYLTTAITLFWTMRLTFQWMHFDTSLWRGKRLETAVHVLFTCTWAFFIAVYATAAYNQWR